jgi:SpoIID/LytB domain protein
MKLVHSLFLATALSLSPLALGSSLYAANLPTDVSQKAKPATIKVLIARNASGAYLEAKGRHHMYNPANGLEITSSRIGSRHPIFVSENGIKWGELLPGIFQMRLVPGDSQSSVLINGIQYRGCVEVYVIDGKLSIINEVDIENYLKSTLATQFSDNLSDDVMNALAITERTNAYYCVSRNPEACWHVDAKESGYQGYALTFQNLHVDRALESTRHVVMTLNHTPFAAAWTKDSAGKTADFSTVFRKNALSPPGVQAPLAAKDRDKHSWSLLVSKDELAKRSKLRNISAIDLYLDQSSGKVYAVRLSDETEAHDFDYLTLQKMIGNKRLLSNDFTARVKGDSILFTGFGEGNGVGLCLYSANIMAEQGEDTQKILSTFFPNTKLENIRTANSLEMIADKLKTAQPSGNKR